jgi:hypothetical protein
MALTVTIGKTIDPDGQEREIQITLPFHARKTLGGNIAIFDHQEIDIVVDPKKKTITAFPKEKYTDRVYDTQNIFFKYLCRRGVTSPETVQGAKTFGAMQASYPDNDEISALQAALYNIHNFLEMEADRFSTYDEFESEFEERYTEPEEADSTELGEVPHGRQKGSIRPGYIYSPYGISSIYRYE